MEVLLQIDEKSQQPMFRQIMDQIIELVDTETLKPGTRLPSSRLLAEKLSVNRSTVYKAYQELWSLGYLDSTPGSYSRIRPRPKIAKEQKVFTSSCIEWEKRVTPAGRELRHAYDAEKAMVPSNSGPDVINFIPLSPDSSLFPVEAFRKCMNSVLSERGIELLQYGNSLGFLPLRRYISERMRLHRISISPDEIIITTGAQNALELLAKLLTEPGADVVLEAPTYSRALSIFRLNSVNLINVPMNSLGMDLDALEALLRERDPAMVYTMPNFHNPTGITTDQGHRERLLRICEHHRIPLVEDGFEEEMKYFGKAVLPIKSMDHGRVVIYIGTFSKVLFPGLRIGWIAADKQLIKHLVPIQQASILSGNQLDQAALYRFCRQGHYDRHIQRIHRIYRKRMTAALDTMDAAFARKNVAWTRPAGGYTIWLRLRGMKTDESYVHQRIVASNIHVLPGSTHFYGASDGIYFRLSIAHLNEEKIREGILRLGKCIEEII